LPMHKSQRFNSITAAIGAKFQASVLRKYLL